MLGWRVGHVPDPVLTGYHRADMLADRQERPALRRRAARFERVEALFAAYEPDAHGHRAEVLVEPLAQRHLDACVALAVQREGGDPAAWRTALEGGIEATDRASFVALVDGVLADLDALGVRRTLLATADAHGLYAQYGFEPLAEPRRWMGRGTV